VLVWFPVVGWQTIGPVNVGVSGDELIFYGIRIPLPH
jgi:hypothetical protein